MLAKVMSGTINERASRMKIKKSQRILERTVTVIIGQKHGLKKACRDGLRRQVCVKVNFGKKNGTRKLQDYQISVMSMASRFLTSMSPMEVKLKRRHVRSMARMTIPKKNGMRNGAKSTSQVIKKNGVTSGKQS